jgi:hypothetical protein
MIGPEDVPVPHTTGTHTAIAAPPPSFLPDESFSQRELYRRGQSILKPGADKARRFRIPRRKVDVQWERGIAGNPLPTTQVPSAGQKHRSTLPMNDMIQQRRAVQPPPRAHQFYGMTSREKKIWDRRLRKAQSQRDDEDIADENTIDETILKLQALRKNHEEGSAIPEDTSMLASIPAGPKKSPASDPSPANSLFGFLTISSAIVYGIIILIIIAVVVFLVVRSSRRGKKKTYSKK